MSPCSDVKIGLWALGIVIFVVFGGSKPSHITQVASDLTGEIVIFEIAKLLFL